MAPGRQDRDRYWTLFGDWVRARLAEQKPDKWTQVRLRDELADIGIAVKREWVNQVINGKPPSDDLRKGIERLLGSFPEPDGGGDANTDAYLRRIDSLVGEMAEDRKLIRALLAELQRVRRAPAGLTPDEQARLDEWAAISPGGSPPAAPASPTAPARSGESA